jgi:hypothetical protein
MIERLRILGSNRNRWLLVVFLCYLAFVFAFGIVYYAIYENNRSAFAFNADIVRSQSRTVKIESQHRLEQLASELALLQQLKEELNTIDTQPTIGLEFGGLMITSSVRGSNAVYTVIWPKARFTAPGPGIPPPTDLRVSSLDGRSQVRIIGNPEYDLPRSIAEFNGLCDRWIADWEANSRNVRTVLDSLETDSPDVWSYWDFLYFSAITQFTVGYGDILPNSTSVRIVVLLQTCIAALLLVVVINVAFRTSRIQ